MNKRIRELADRAGEYADFESGLCTDEFLKKFAELIVRECAEQICQGPFYAGAAAKYIKEHFGVQE
jgi:hypothetical protein